MARATAHMRGPRPKGPRLCRSRAIAAVAAATASGATLGLLSIGLSFASSAAPRGLRGLRGLLGGGGSRAALPPGVQQERGAASQAPMVGKQRYALHVGVTDHYVWQNVDTFVGIVADAGEWTVEVPTIKAAFDTAKREGSAAVFSAPLYVVKEYVKELQNYGLAAEAFPVEKEEEVVEEEDDVFSRKDWSSLSPEAKEAAGPQDSSGAGHKSVVIISADHATLNGMDAGDGKRASMKFRAYVEMASDAARKWCPEEAELNAAYAQILGSKGRAAVLRHLEDDAAEAAAAQLRKAGFEVEVEEDQPASR